MAPIVVAGAKRGVKQREGHGWLAVTVQAQVQKQRIETGQMWNNGVSMSPGADALLIVTEWDAFRALDLGRMKGLPERPGAGRSAQ